MAVLRCSDTGIVHLLFHGIGAPGPGVSAEDEGYFVSKDLFYAVLDEICEMAHIGLSWATLRAQIAPRTSRITSKMAGRLR